MIEKTEEFPACNRMGKSVTAPMRSTYPGEGAASLYAAGGSRKYLNRPELDRALAAMDELPAALRLFALTLSWTGARISEVLALTPSAFQMERGVVAIVTLKRRRFHVREVPIPPVLMRDLDAHFGLAEAQRLPSGTCLRLWSFSRTTAWRAIKRVMKDAGIAGARACPKGFRHAFGVGTLHSGVPLNLTQRWLGHASARTTAIYAEAMGPEELAFAQRFWLPNTGAAT